MAIEDDFMDVLQNIEFAIVNACHQHPQLCDYDVIRVLEALIHAYALEQRGHPPRPHTLSPAEEEMLSQVRAMCERRLGREKLDEAQKHPEAFSPRPITVDNLIQCLKWILKSARRWNREGGRRGYLTFVSQFIR